MHSRWRVYDVQREPRRTRFRARGFGYGQMLWRLRPNTRYAIEIKDGTRTRAGLRLESGADGLVEVDLGAAPQGELLVSIMNED